MAGQGSTSKQDKKTQEQQDGCGGKTREQWMQLIGFYTVFYGFLIAFFAICYSVMFYTLPDRSDAPKLDNLIDPGLVFFPDVVSLRDVGSADFMRSIESETNDLMQFGERNDIIFGDTSRFGPCAVLLDGNTTTTYEQLEPCIFAKLNRVFHFPENLDPIPFSVSLDFPSTEEFEQRFGIAFTDFVDQHVTLYPTQAVPSATFTNQQDNSFLDLMVAVQMNFSSFEQDILSGTEWDFRIGVQADWGQDLEESGNGYETIDITVRND